MEISNIEERAKALAEMDEIMERTPAADSPDGLRFNELADAVVTFEKDHLDELAAGVPAHQGHWGYRIVRYHATAAEREALGSPGYGLHEVYFDAEGLPWSMTQDQCGFGCVDDEALREDGKSVDPVAEITKWLATAIRDANNYPIFDEPEVWPGKNPGGPAG